MYTHKIRRYVFYNKEFTLKRRYFDLRHLHGVALYLVFFII